MFSCPGCRTRIAAPLPQSHWTCPHCQGTHIPFGILKVVAGSAHVRRVDEALRIPLGIHETKRCLRCGLRLTTLGVATGGSPVMVDICSRCRFLWYERGTLRAPEAAPTAAPVVFDGAAARQLEPPDPNEDTVVDWTPSAAPLPTEEEVFVPATTLVTLTALAAGSLHAFQNWVPAARQYGFFTEAPWRHLGLTWFTASLVQNSWPDLVMVVLFMFAFGEVVERRLGVRHFIRLMLVATIGGRLLTLAFIDGRDLGAIGMTCGVIAFQLLTAPHARLLSGRFFRHGIPAWGAGAAFLLERFWESPPHEAFSYLGGAIGGALCWALVRLPKRQAAERRLTPR